MGTKNQLAVSGLVVLIVAAVALAAAFAFSGDDIEDTPAAVTSASPEAPAATPKEVAIESSGVDEITDDSNDIAPPALQPAEEPVEALQDAPLVEPDPDYLRNLQRAGIRPIGWTTDFSLHSVDFREISSGGVPRDGIPPLDDPQFTTPALANDWLADREPVIALEINGEAKAYPLQILIWHEIANDVVGGVPVTVTFCPLCNSALVFERTLDSVIHDFGVSGNLRNSDLIMWDRQTETWWQQFTGEAIVGELTGKQLKIVSSVIVSWETFRDAYPTAPVLSRDTGYDRSYGVNPYVGYDTVDNPPFLFKGKTDGRLQPKERVVALTVDGEDVAFPFAVLQEERVVGYGSGEHEVVVFFESGTTSALNARSISGSDDVGASGVFRTVVDGDRLTFRADADQFIDNETGSIWSILGLAIDGPLAGKQLEPVVHANHPWFAWGAFKPDTKIYQGDGPST